MNLQSLNHHPRLTTALQLALLMVIFQAVVQTTPGLPSGPGRPAAVQPSA